MAFSAADLTLLRIRCSACGQHTEKLVTMLIRKDTLTCNTCGTAIDLMTPHNMLLIAETAKSCARIGAKLTALLAK
jgi:uncharacterized Zn finger protein